MKATKKQLENAVLNIANFVDKGSSYEMLLKSEASMPKIVQMIIYDMFLKQFNSYFVKDNELYKNYRTIYEYSVELEQNGFVKYEN